jgi:hypothetical protein
MSKYLMPVFAGLGVAFAVGLVLGVLTGFDFTTVYIAGFFGVVTAYILANLAGNRKVAIAPAAEREVALRFEAPGDKAVVYVFREGFMGKAAGMEIALDGLAVAQLKSPRFTRLTLSAGPHTLSAYYGGLAGAQNRPSTYDLDAVAGSVTLLGVGASMGFLSNGLNFTPAVDIEAAKAKLAGFPMVMAEGAAAG